MSVSFNLHSHEWKPDPYSKYRELRDHAPVHWSPEAETWIVSRHADIQQVLTSPEVFSSKTQMRGRRERGFQELSAVQKVGVLFRVMRDMKAMPQTLAKSRMLIQEDGEPHAVMRRLVNRGFTPRRVKAWEGRVAELVDDGMARIRAGGPFDLVQELAIPLPVTVIAEWLGVEPEHHHTFKRWSDAIIQGATGSGMASFDVKSPLWAAMREMRAYMSPIVKERRARPTDDLISVLVQADGDATLSGYEVFLFILLLLIAGNETTTNLLGNAVDALLAHPDQLERVAADPSLVPGLVEETLRFDAPVQFITRWAREDAEIAGTKIPKDSLVSVLLGSGNRDERFWDEPDRFDVSRSTSGHVGFGFGAHFCLGASLARLEAKAALEALVPELPRLARVRPEVEFLDSYLIRGRTRLELKAA